jgi:hypothetical protein
MVVNPLKARQNFTLQQIVSVLNGEGDETHPLHSEIQVNLVQLVGAWQAAHDAQHPIERNMELNPYGARVPILIKMDFPPACPIRKWNEIESRCRAFLPPVGSGANRWVEYHTSRKRWDDWDQALNLFVWLVTNTDRDKLSGPCARCQRFYIKKRASQKVYCSRACGNAATAIIRTREKWDEERNAKLECARKAAAKWAKSKSTQPWKRYVCSTCPGLTPKFLTRAVNQNELTEPKRS